MKTVHASEAKDNGMLVTFEAVFQTLVVAELYRRQLQRTFLGNHSSAIMQTI